VQQSRARKKDEFRKAFGGIIAEAMQIAYRGTTHDVQSKLRRVLEVWRARNVFEPQTLGEVDQRLDCTYHLDDLELMIAIDNAKEKGGIIRPTRSISGPPIPPELVMHLISELTLLEFLDLIA
jgi:CID domain